MPPRPSPNLQEKDYSWPADVWSFGITLLELAHGHAPFAAYPPLKVGRPDLTSTNVHMPAHLGMYKRAHVCAHVLHTCVWRCMHAQLIIAVVIWLQPTCVAPCGAHAAARPMAMYMLQPLDTYMLLPPSPATCVHGRGLLACSRC